MSFLWLKSLHIIFVVTWFAGLFYIIRLFIYQTEAQDKSDVEKRVLTDQFKLMSRRLWYGITWPSAVLTLIFGTSVLWQRPFYLDQPWMHIKLTFVVLLFVYHYLSHRIFINLQNDKYSYSLKLFSAPSKIDKSTLCTHNGTSFKSGKIIFFKVLFASLPQVENL